MIDNQDRQHLERTKLFAGVSLEAVKHLLDSCHKVKLERGKDLLEAGAAADHLYLFLGGELLAGLISRADVALRRAKKNGRQSGDGGVATRLLDAVGCGGEADNSTRGMHSLEQFRHSQSDK